MTTPDDVEPINPRKLVLLVLLFPLVIGIPMVAIFGGMMSSLELAIWAVLGFAWFVAWVTWAGRWVPPVRAPRG